ncbi:hypothetical protein B484DRAFT_470077, partial [Ochromonadaceae sp. CCMP2298]
LGKSPLLEARGVQGRTCSLKGGARGDSLLEPLLHGLVRALEACAGHGSGLGQRGELFGVLVRAALTRRAAHLCPVAVLHAQLARQVEGAVELPLPKGLLRPLHAGVDGDLGHQGVSLLSCSSRSACSIDGGVFTKHRVQGGDVDGQQLQLLLCVLQQVLDLQHDEALSVHDLRLHDPYGCVHIHRQGMLEVVHAGLLVDEGEGEILCVPVPLSVVEVLPLFMCIARVHVLRVGGELRQVALGNGHHLLD